MADQLQKPTDVSDAASQLGDISSTLNEAEEAVENANLDEAIQVIDDQILKLQTIRTFLEEIK